MKTMAIATTAILGTLLTVLVASEAMAGGSKARPQTQRVVSNQQAVVQHRVNPVQQRGPSVKVNPGGLGVKRPKLGFNGSFAPSRSGAYAGINVDHVLRDTLAERIGLERGDIIVRINGKTLCSNADYHRALKRALQYHHGHVTMEVDDIRSRWGQDDWTSVKLVSTQVRRRPLVTLEFHLAR